MLPACPSRFRGLLKKHCRFSSPKSNCMARCFEKAKTSVTIEGRNKVIPYTALACIKAATIRPAASYSGLYIIRDKVRSLLHEIIKVREWIPHIGPLTKVIPFKVIPLKLFYYQTFFEIWRNEHSWHEHYKNAIKIWGHRACLRVSRFLKWGIFTAVAR